MGVSPFAARHSMISVKLRKPVYFSSFLAASIVSSKAISLTRGVIFEVDGREISFEKQNIPFSEEIDIQRGYDLIENYSNVNDFSEDWDPGIRAIATREIVKIT